MTLGGYLDADMDGEIEWYDTTYSEYSWTLQMSNFTLDGIDLMTAPEPEPTSADEHYGGPMLRGDESYPVYAHFNSAYPFLGADEMSGDLIWEDLMLFRPDIECPNAQKTPTTENPWNACYYEGECSTDFS